MAARRRTTARAAVLPARRALPELGQVVPSLRSVGVGLLLAVLAVAAYAGARETSVFAVRTIDVRGGTPALRADLRAALAGLSGTSLLKIDTAAVASRVGPVPEVRTFTFDRDFPHTLRVVVKRELPVLVVRVVPGKRAFLVAASGKVLRTLPHPRRSSLPRLWVKDVPVAVGNRLPAAVRGAATALAAVRGSGLPGGVRTVQTGADELTLTLGSGLQVRLGSTGDLRLKLAITRRILRMTGAASAGGGYVDVSLPERPVLNSKSQVGG